MVQRDRLGGHRHLGAAELERAVVADDHVLEPQEQLGRERLAGQVGGLRDLVAEHLHAHDQVADELALVGVAEGAVVAELVDLADVVEEDARHQQVAVEVGVEVGDPVGDRQQRDDVLEQPGLVGVVVADAGRGRGELAEELVVDQEAVDEGAEVGVADRLEEQLAEPRGQLGDVLRGLGQELLGLDPRGVDGLDVREDDLQGALEDLDLAADVEEVAGLEGPGQPLAGVPEPGRRRCRSGRGAPGGGRGCPGGWPGAACRRPGRLRRRSRRWPTG